MKREGIENSTCEVTLAMADAGYVAYLAERPRVEDGDEGDRLLAFTAIFCAMLHARVSG